MVAERDKTPEEGKGATAPPPAPVHEDGAPTPERVVRDYDFRRPQNLSAEQIRAVQTVHLAAADGLRVRLSRYLNARVAVRMDRIEEMTYALLMEALGKHTYVNVLDLAPIEERGLLTVDAGLALAFVDRALGGAGVQPSAPRCLTAIDEVGVESVIHLILSVLAETWKGFCPLQMSAIERRSNPSQVQILGPADAVLCVQFAFSGDLGDGIVRLCLPIAGLKATMDGAAQRGLGLTVDPERLPAIRESLVQSLAKARLPLTACVGRGEIPIRNLLTLTEGDVLKLNQPSEAPVVLSIAGRPMFYVKMGVQARNKAVQVLERIPTE